MKCAVCYRQAKGYGWFNARRSRSDPMRYCDDWKFCSRRCQNAFSNLMNKTDGQMIDPTEMEINAMNACLPNLGELVVELGIERPLATYSKDEILSLIEVVVTSYQSHMATEHERMATRDRTYLEQRLKLHEQTHQTGVPL